MSQTQMVAGEPVSELPAPGFAADLPLGRGWHKLMTARHEVMVRRWEHRLLLNELSAADVVGMQDIPSVMRGNRGERVLAEVDQDGFAFARETCDERVFNGRSRQLRRNRYGIDVVICGGRVCLAKRFTGESVKSGARHWMWNRLGLGFFTEAAALLRLAEVPGVPTVRKIDPATRTIYMDYIDAQNLRHRMARQGVTVHDLDLADDAELGRLTDAQREEREISLLAKLMEGRLEEKIRALVAAMNRCGVAPMDIKPGNVLVGRKSGNLYWVDFERAHLRGWPGWEQALEKQQQMLDRWFDGRRP